MLIAVDVAPISSQTDSQHKVRGVGMYLSLLKDNLEKYDRRNNYIFSSNIREDGKEADIVHYPYLDPFFVTFPIFKKKKTVITVHDLIPISYPKHFPAGVKGKISWQINRKILHQADLILADSEASRENIVKFVGVSHQKVKSVLLGVSEHFRKVNLHQNDSAAISEKYNLPKNFFLYVGDVTWNKNLPTLIKAVKEVNIPIVMVGKALVTDFDKSNMWNKDRIVVSSETSSKLFIKPGFVSEEELVKLYNMAIAVCMPSVDEGFGLPVLEGMSCGTPVIVSGRGSLPEVAGEAGIYVDHANYLDIASKMRDVANNRAVYQKYSDLSLKRSHFFSIEKMIRETISAYELLNEKTS